MWSGFQDSDGEIFFATNSGVFRFFPEKVHINDRRPDVVFTSLKLFNKPVEVTDPSKLLSKDISQTEKIIFGHDQSIFTIEFAVLDYLRPEKNRYAYKLDGFEKNWNYVSNPSATYTNLPPGDYTLLVKGANNDGLWSTKPVRMNITVLSPWWSTWYAYVIYSLLFGTVIFLLMRFLWLRHIFKRENRLHEAKLDFFTNISHEIRTHLTLIGGPIEKALQSQHIVPEIQHYLSHSKRNSDRLMNLVNELLDFRKIESRQSRLHVKEHDLVIFLKNILTSFEHLGIDRKITTKFQGEETRLHIWFDDIQLQKVIYNLLSNAFKFVDDGGEVILSLEEASNEVKIKVSDNGKGIDPEYLDKIFSNFFQVNDLNNPNRGYGIGLAMAREIVKMHHGNLTVSSTIEKVNQDGNTCFTVQLLKGNKHFSTDELSSTSGAPFVPINENELLPVEHISDNTEPIKRKNCILLIEDNDELRNFEKESLIQTYEIIEASNGLEGLEMATKQIPDLIISDVMMPGLNGLDLCIKLKSGIETSHIPIILLTAKSTTSQMIEGLKTGADSYITKPFSIQVLDQKIKNLLKSRDTLRGLYSRSITLEPNGINLSNVEEQFLQKIKQIIEENINNQELGVNVIADHVAMSVSVLYRKLRALTGMTVNDFIKSIRMKRAMTLLSLNRYSVSEVAMMVGFENRKHFSQEFKKQFGKTPRECLKESAT